MKNTKEKNNILEDGFPINTFRAVWPDIDLTIDRFQKMLSGYIKNRKIKNAVRLSTKKISPR